MISNEKHKKHGDIKRAALGVFGRNEVAVLGTTCQDVSDFVKKMRAFFSEANIAFVDAEHGEDITEFEGTHWQNKNECLQVLLPPVENDFQKRILLSGSNAIIVNGNHFSASRQIIVCNESKEKSLLNRVEQITDVRGIVLVGDQKEVPDYVKNIVLDWKNKEVIAAGDDDGLRLFFQKEFLNAAPLKALIMAGGRSVRMGVDKSRIRHYDEEQFLHLSKILQQLNIEAYISCRPDQVDFFKEAGCSTVQDRLNDVGPLGGVVSAFMMDPDSAWLVLACDIPLLDSAVISELLAARNHYATASAFRSAFDQFPEPLIAVWEPRSYPIALQFIAQGYSCPRKVLINSGVHVVICTTPEKLENVNTREELNDIAEKLNELKSN